MASGTAVLLCDFQETLLGFLPDKDRREKLVSQGVALRDLAAEKGWLVVHIEVKFRNGHPSVSDRNKMFYGLKQGGLLVDGASGTATVEALAPRENELLVVKRRIGAFSTTDLAAILRSKGIFRIILAGFSSSGVILNTSREAADLDFEVITVSDCCDDSNADVHACIMDHILPMTGTVCTLDDARKL